MAGITKEERQQLLRALKTADDNFKRGMYALAEPTYRKSIEVLGDGSAEICDCLMNLALICTERKDLNEALKLKIRALLLHEERFGEDSTKTIALMDDIAGLYERLGRIDESRDMYERARKASERSLWADQQNEPDIDDDGNLKPAAKDLEIGFQYSDTAKSALESESESTGAAAIADAEGIAASTGIASSVEKNNLSGNASAQILSGSNDEETMKLPRFTDDMVPPPPPKDPQLETLIMNKADFKAQQEAALKNPIAAESKSNGSETKSNGRDTADVIKPKPNASQSKMVAAARADAVRSLSASQHKMPVTETAILAETPESAPLEKTENEPAGKTANTPAENTEKTPTEKAEWKSIFGGQKNKIKDPSIKISESELAEERTDLAKLDPDAFELKPKAEKKELEVVELKLFKTAKQRNVIIGLVLGCFALLLLAGLFASHNNPNDDYNNLPHRYRTTDGEKLLFLSSPDDCEYVAGSETTKMKYQQYHGDFKDTLNAVFSPLINHPYWLIKTKNGLLDEKGAQLFAEASPELELADRMIDLGRSAQLTYLKSHHYPKKVDELEAGKRVYKNPYTSKPDKPTIQLANFGKKTQLDDGGIRKKLNETVASGVRWANEPKRRPGAINCMSTVIHTKKTDINSFFVRGFDKNNLPITGNDGKTVFAVMIENGTLKPSPRAHLPFSKTAVRPHTTWLLNEANSGMLIWFKYGAAILFAVMAFLFGVLSVNVSSDKANAALKILMLTSTILALVYLFGNGML